MNYETDLSFHRELLVLLAKRMRPAMYLEIGSGTGGTIHAVARHCQVSVGVDVRAPSPDYYNGLAWRFIESTSKAFWKGYDGYRDAESDPWPAPELVFVDADHDADAVYHDIAEALKRMPLDGILVLHDTYPENEKWCDAKFCDDAYEAATWRYYSSLDDGIELATLPCPPGLTIIRKRPPHGLAWL